MAVRSGWHRRRRGLLVLHGTRRSGRRQRRLDVLQFGRQHVELGRQFELGERFELRCHVELGRIVELGRCIEFRRREPAVVLDVRLSLLSGADGRRRRHLDR
jgi:hypothetical protein